MDKCHSSICEYDAAYVFNHTTLSTQVHV